jgi:hypothetical protein
MDLDAHANIALPKVSRNSLSQYELILKMKQGSPTQICRPSFAPILDSEIPSV